MIKVKYKVQMPIDSFRVRERTNVLYAESYFKPNGIDLIYFKVNPFHHVTVAKGDIISIEERS